MRLQQHNKRMSKSLLYLLLIISTFAVYYLIIGPLYTGTGGVWQPAESVQALQVLNRQYDETLMQADSLRAEAQTLQKEYQNISDDQKAEMKIMVPDSIDKVRLLSEVSSILVQSGFSAQDLAYSEGAVRTDGRGSAALSFTVKTTYPRFKELMDTFEKSMRLFSIQGVTFSAPDKETDLTSYSVRLETYYIK
jgi:hypothetical protein